MRRTGTHLNCDGSPASSTPGDQEGSQASQNEGRRESRPIHAATRSRVIFAPFRHSSSCAGIRVHDCGIISDFISDPPKPKRETSLSDPRHNQPNMLNNKTAAQCQRTSECVRDRRGEGSQRYRFQIVFKIDSEHSNSAMWMRVMGP